MMLMRTLLITLFLAAPAGAETLANQLFGAATAPSQNDPMPVGSYARGCAAGLVELPETGPTWQAMRLSRGRNFGQPVMIAFLKELSVTARDIGFGKGLYIGDIQPRGGPMTSGHASHQIGLDADIWMLPPARLSLSEADREAISSIPVRSADQRSVTENWTSVHRQLLKAAALDPRVDRIKSTIGLACHLNSVLEQINGAGRGVGLRQRCSTITVQLESARIGRAKSRVERSKRFIIKLIHACS